MLREKMAWFSAFQSNLKMKSVPDELSSIDMKRYSKSQTSPLWAARLRKSISPNSWQKWMPRANSEQLAVTGSKKARALGSKKEKPLAEKKGWQRALLKVRRRPGLKRQGISSP